MKAPGGTRTVRFAQVVESAGRPETHTLWLAPEKDKVFGAALKEHRVMTVHQNTTGSRSDSGEIGYIKGGAGEFLIFPKSLKKFEGKRVVGIKYELLKEEPPAREKEVAKAKPPASKRPPAHPRGKLIPFPKPERAAPPKKETAAAGPARELKAMKQKVREALEALSKDQHVTAFKILQQLVAG